MLLLLHWTNMFFIFSLMKVNNYVIRSVVNYIFFKQTWSTIQKKTKNNKNPFIHFLYWLSQFAVDDENVRFWIRQWWNMYIQCILTVYSQFCYIVFSGKYSVSPFFKEWKLKKYNGKCIRVTTTVFIKFNVSSNQKGLIQICNEMQFESNNTVHSVILSLLLSLLLSLQKHFVGGTYICLDYCNVCFISNFSYFY